MDMRDSYNVNDIAGAKPKPPLARKVVHDQVYEDVFKKKVLARENPFNPQDPVYKIKNDQGEIEEYGLIKGSKPKSAYYRTNDNEKDNALKSRDIKGNTPGSRLLGAFHDRMRRTYRDSGKNDDIKGSAAGTIKHGI